MSVICGGKATRLPKGELLLQRTAFTACRCLASNCVGPMKFESSSQLQTRIATGLENHNSSISADARIEMKESSVHAMTLLRGHALSVAEPCIGFPEILGRVCGLLGCDG